MIFNVDIGAEFTPSCETEQSPLNIVRTRDQVIVSVHSDDVHIALCVDDESLSAALPIAEIVTEITDFFEHDFSLQNVPAE